MEAWIIIVAVIAVLALVAVGGAVAQRRRMAATRGRFDANLERVNADLAAAHAADNGWDPARLRAIAQRAAAEHGEPGAEPRLVAIVDPPGTDADKAVFEIRAGGRERRMTLGRRGDDWVVEAVE